MTKEASLLWLVLGLALFTVSRLLSRAELVHGQGQLRLPSPFGDALAALLAWVALGGLLAAALYQLGLPATALAVAAALAAPRLLPAGPALTPFLSLKLPLALGAALVAALLLYGVLTHYEGVFYG